MRISDWSSDVCSSDVRRYAEEAISQSGSGRLAPFYDNVRRHFAWMDASGADVLKTAFDVLKDEGLLTYGTARDRLTVDWVEQQTQEAHLPPLDRKSTRLNSSH